MTSRNSPPQHPLKKAVILAAGKGTRMQNLTDQVPKPMLKVAGKPILEHMVAGLVAEGVRDFLIITGHQAQTIETHFGNGGNWGASIVYARQVKQDGTGRVVELARAWLKKAPFFLAYGDILVTRPTYKLILDQWKKSSWDAILSVRLGENIHKGGLALFDEKFFLKDLVEKPNEEEIAALCRRFGEFKPWYNAALYVFTSRIFEYTAKLQPSSRGEYELTDAIRTMALDGLKIKGLEIGDFWMDVRDPESLKAANKLFKDLYGKSAWGSAKGYFGEGG